MFLSDFTCCQVIEQGHVPAFWRDRPVAYSCASCFGEEDNEYEEPAGGEDDQEPEERAPAEKLRQDSSYDRADGRAQQCSCGDKAHVFASFLCRCDVCYYTTGEGDGAAAACTLEASQKKERGIAVLECQAYACSDVDHETEEVGWSSASGVSQLTNEGRCETLENHIAC